LVEPADADGAGGGSGLATGGYFAHWLTPFE